MTRRLNPPPPGGAAVPVRARGRHQPWTVIHRRIWVALVTLAPIAAFIRAMNAGWEPEGDDATIVLRSREVLHGEIPLQGMRSTAGGGGADAANHHLGPLELHILMPASIVGTGWAIALTCVAVAAVCSVAVVYWAHRIGGDPSVVVFGSGVLIVQWAIGPEAMFRPFNPYFGLLPIYLALVLLAAHFARLPMVGWPLVLTTGVVAQANLAYAPIGVGIAAVALVVCAWRVFRENRLYPRRFRWRRISARKLWRFVSWRSLRRPRPCARSVGVVSAVVVWGPVLAEPLRYDPGNLKQLFKAALSDEPSQGVGSALARLGMFVPLPGGFRTLGPDLVYEPAQGASTLGWLVVLAVLVAALVPWGSVRRRKIAMIPARAALVGMASTILTLAALPIDGLANHYFASVIPVVIFTWAATCWRATLHVGHLRRRFTRTTTLRTAVPAVCLALVLSFVATPASFVAANLGRGASALVSAAASDLPPNTHFDIAGRGFLASLSTAPAVALTLERSGFKSHYLYPWPSSEDAARLARAKAPPDSIKVVIVGSDASDRTPPPGASKLGTVRLNANEYCDVYLTVPDGI